MNIALCMVQLPAVNTPQFDWCLNRTDHAVAPVPPIFQPEIIADAIHRLSRHPRREVFLGGSAIKAIIGNKLVPGIADRYLASRGYTGQLTGEPNLNGPANLFAPVSGDHGAHGRFDAQARSRDPIAQIATLLGGAGVQAAIAAGVTLVGALFVAAAARRIARRSS